MTKEKKCKDCNKIPFDPVCYIQTKMTPELMESICEMTLRGITVYYQYGKPECPDPGGCPPDNE